MIDLNSIPFVGPLVAKISDKTIEALFRHVEYMFRYKGLVKDLKSENDKLLAEETKMSRQAEQESNNGRILEKFVVDWQNNVEQNQEIVRRCLEENEKQINCPYCNWCIPLPHPITRYRLGKEAAKVAKTTTELTATGSCHLASPIAYLPLDMNVPVTAFQEFKSREVAYEKMKGLVSDESPSILGIYGIAGAGKTRLMERITTEAGKKGTFAKVVRANVGYGKLDLIGIQQQLAGKLGCRFESKTDVELRAGQLRSSLRQGGKILVILDDVWSEIPLATIGILCADGMSSEGGKILLTTRDHEVCQQNNCKDPVKVEPLKAAEAWDMFTKTVGADKMDSLAKDICKKCGGLPLVILAVGNALKFKPRNSWKDARTQLENYRIEKVPGISGEIDPYACLKWSFDNLVDDAKACLLLASIFPEDADIPSKSLVELARGSQLIKADDIRTRVYSMIYTLKSASLLQGRLGSEHIKLHDIIRDMARSIAIKDYGFLFVTRSSSLPKHPADYSGLKVLHIYAEEETHLRFPSNVACPDLHTLSLHSSSWGTPLLQEWIFSSGQIFTNLTFLALVRFFWPQELCLKSLSNLKTLWFDECDLKFFGETAVKFLPEMLENLCIWHSLNLKQLNLPELNYLRKLDIDCRDELCMVPKTISRLSSLEELRLPWDFNKSEECAEGRSLSLLDEISELPDLTSLHIRSRVSKSSKLATMFSNLREFQLFVGEPLANYWSMNLSPVSMTKSIKLVNHDLVEGYQTLFQKAEEVILYETDFPGSIGIGDTKEFINLRYMQIENCKAMKYLAMMSTQHGEIQESLQRSTPFSNLIKLRIKHCPSLEYLFCDSIARCLLLLEELHIRDCPLMEEVVREEGKSDGNIIIMSKLRIMILSNLPRLIHFYKDKVPCAQIQPLFDGMVEFPSLEELDIRGLEDITDIWGDNNDNASSFSQLKKLNVWDCNKLKYVIPPAMLRSSLPSEVDTLESNTDSVTNRASQGHVKAMVSHNPNKKLVQMFLKKTACVSRSICMRTPMITEENLNDPSDISVQVPSQNTRVCPLTQMTLGGLPCLEKTGLNFEDQSGGVSLYPNLRRLDIYECDTLLNVFIPFPQGYFMSLEDITVTNCYGMRVIIGPGKQKIANDIVFHKLCFLKLSGLPGLTSFWGCPSGEANNHKVEFPNLKTFGLSCSKITSLEMIELGSRDDFNLRLEMLNISCDEEIQIPNQWLPHLNNLESLSLTRCWSDALKSLRFQRLKSLTLGELSCSTIFSFPDFERLQQLRNLKITNCSSLEEIVEVVKGEEASGMDTETAALLVQLESVNLEGLPKLKTFIHTKSKNLIPSLEQVEVESSILFRCSVFGIVQQLKELEVIDCRLLEGIVEVARDYQPSYSIIKFPQISIIKLKDLPNLQNFSPPTRYSFKMPKLLYFQLFRCPQVENKPFLQIFAESVHVSSEEHPLGIKVGNLKDYIRRINKLESVGESSKNKDYTRRINRFESVGESSKSKDYTRRINKLESVGESSTSISNNRDF